MKSLVFWSLLTLYAVANALELIFFISLIPMWAKRERIIRHALTVSRTLASAKDTEAYANSAAQKEKDLTENIQKTRNELVAEVKKTVKDSVQEVFSTLELSIKKENLTAPPEEYNSPFDQVEKQASANEEIEKEYEAEHGKPIHEEEDNEGKEEEEDKEILSEETSSDIGLIDDDDEDENTNNVIW